MQYRSPQKKPVKNAITISILLCFQVLSYSHSITGKITDQDNDAIFNAQVLNLSSNDHAHTDESGMFVLKSVNIGDTLRFTHLVYKTKTLIITEIEKPLHIVMDDAFVSIDQIVIVPEIDAINLITDIDIQTEPVNSSQDILRAVPGLFIGQHAGGGKAEQIFLRGFDIDHGTDIAINVDGLPVNMVSHAHGQGYADLHFVIPETVSKIDFGKGPYYADKGNFNTAGYVDFKTRKSIDESTLKIETGRFNTHRILGMFNVANTNKHKSYLAAERISSDGPFESPQNFNRLNIIGKYTATIGNNDRIGGSLSHFTSTWDASGQIPERAVNDGSISRFGAIDDTEGGNTSRSNLTLEYDKFITQKSLIKNSFFISKYDFELFSNFTFFLDDPINGDQIRQNEKRTIYGFNSEYFQSFETRGIDGNWQIGISLRNDQSNNNELSHTLNRKAVLEYYALGDINETNIGGYINSEWHLGKWMINPSIRMDIFNYQYKDALSPTYQNLSTAKSIVSPKLNLLYNFSSDLQLYLKTGKGFHSNDTRVAVAQNGNKILPAAYGADLGFIWKPIPNLVINSALWYLFLEQEFVYVGDAGIVEPSGETKRQGIDLSVRYQISNNLFWDFDTNYTLARSSTEEKGMDYIPLAPNFTMVSGLKYITDNGLYAGANVRFLDDRPANEDNSIVAKGYTVVDMNLGYVWRSLDFGLQVQNLLNTEWNETQFATESRLQNEPQPVEEIHFTPGTPFFIKGVVSFRF